MNQFIGSFLKKIQIVLLVAGLLTISCREKFETIELPRIEYDVLLNNYGNNFSWFEHMDGFTRTDFFQSVIDAAKSGKFNIEDMNGKTILAEKVDSLLDHYIVENDTIIQCNPETMNGLRFREVWKINSGTGMIKKEVIAFCPLYFRHHPMKDDSQTIEVYPLFWIYPAKETSTKGMSVIAEKIASDVVIDNSLPMIRGSYGTQLPFYFLNIEPSYRKKIVNALLDAGFRKRTTAFDFTFNEIKEHELSQIESRTDTLSVWNMQSGGLTDSVVVYRLDREKVLRIKFAEEWSFNKQSLTLVKKVLAVAPAEISYDEKGEFKGFRFLFWLLFDKNMKEKLQSE